jgi:cell division protein FtsW (lipid II flippase)
VYFFPDFGHTFLVAVGFLAAIFFAAVPARAYSAAMTTGVASQAMKAALARLV